MNRILAQEGIIVRNKYPLQIKKLPKDVKEAWFYGGKEKSIHIVFHPQQKLIALGDGVNVAMTFEIPQININF